MNFKKIGTVLSTLLIISALTACGTNETNGEDTEEPKKVVSGSNGEQTSGIVAGQLTPDLEKHIENGKLMYKFTIKNDKEKEDVLEYSSSQQYDYHILDSKGTILYTYSMDKMFLQQVSEQEIKQGEVITFDIDLSEDLKKLQPGTYQLEVWSSAKDRSDLKVEEEFNWGGEGEGLEDEASSGKLAGAVVTFVGLMDQNSIEVINENGDIDHYRLSDKVKPQFETLATDTKINVGYGTTSDGQKIVLEVKIQ